MIFRGRRIFGILGFAATSAVCAPGLAQDVPAGAEIIKEIDVGTGFGSLGVVQPDGDDKVVVPRGIAVVPGEGIVVLDNVNLRLIRISLDGSQLSVRNTLPRDSEPMDIAARSGELYILDGEKARVIQPGRSGGRSLGSGGRSFGRSDFGNFVGLDDDGEPESLPAPPASGGRSLGSADDFRRPSPTLFNYREQFVREGRGFSLSTGAGGRSFERPGRAADFAVAPTADTHEGVDIVTARIIWKSPDARTNDVYVEEIDKTAEGIPVRTAVRRYQRATGQSSGPMPFTAIAPLAEIRVGRNAVASDGTQVFQLQPVVNDDGKVEKFRLLKIKFKPVAQPPRRRDPDRVVEPSIPASAHPWPKFRRAILADQDKARRRRDQFCANAAGEVGTQASVLAKVKAAGDAFSTMPWKVSAATMRGSSCDRGGDWQRARHLDSARAGDTVRGMPYGWGNFDSIESFRKKVEQDGARGGSVCTKAQVISNTAGIDCSGFVHQALGLDSRGKLSTVTMQEHMIDLQNYAALKPGDVLLRPGSHVMFYLGAENGGVRTVESTKSCTGTRFQGVCYSLRDYTEIGGYRPARSVTNCTR